MRLVASAQAPKGVKKIDDAHRTRREAEDNRRQQVQDKFYYTVIGLFKDGKPPEDGPQYALKAKTVEDLEEEMYNMVTGKEDWHDVVVREYKEQIVAKYEQEKTEAAARAKALRLAQEEEAGEVTPLIGYSPAQMAEILRERDEGQKGARMVFDDPQRDSVYRKYVVRRPDAGRLKAVDGKLVVEGTGSGEPGPEEPPPPMPEMEY